MILFHWTERRNLPSIMATGLDPAYATGGQRVVWLARKPRALGMLDCAARTHGVEARRMCLLAVNLPVKDLWKWSVQGVYRSPRLISPDFVQWVSPACLFASLPYRIRRND